MFKEFPEGQSHYENDKCGEPIHNNCYCDEPKPDGEVEIGNAEGRFERCKNCKGRIWH
ncbi:MAG: hypothetical protein AABY22_07180 [Nanoarchaeota archaeon]